MRRSEPLRRREVVGYGLGDLATGLYFNLAVVYLLIFYTDVVGIGPAAAGAILLVARVTDAVTDPLMGVLAHRTRTRFGRYRPWLLVGAPFLALTTVAVFWAPPLGQGGQVAYALVTFILFGVAYTVVNIPYLSLNAAMSGTATGRTTLASARLFCGFVAGFAMYTAYPWLVGEFGGQADGTLRAVTVTALVATVLLVTCFASTREAVPPPVVSTLRGSLAEMVGALRGNRPLYVLQIAFVLLYIGLTVRGASLLFFFRYNLDAEAAFPVVGGLLLGFSLVGIAATPWLSQRFDRVRLLQACAVGFALASLGLAALVSGTTLASLPDGSRIAAAVLFAAASTVSGPPLVIAWALLADTVEHGEAATGVRSEAGVYAASSFVFKLAKALGAGLAGFTLAATGFQAGVTQEPPAAAAILALTLVVPALTSLASAIVMLAYPTTASFRPVPRRV